MTTPPFEEHGLWNYSGESGDWALSGVISLLLLWMNYAPSYGIPVEMPLALLTLTVALLMRRGWQRRRTPGRAGLPEEQRRHLQKVAALGMAGIIVGVVIGVAVFVRDWILFAILLPASLTVGVALYLVVAPPLRMAPWRFFLIPLAALILAGLLRTILSGYDYINLFLLSNAVLSLGMALRLHLGRPKATHR